MEVWGADIGKAYLEATTKEKLRIVACPEFFAPTHTNSVGLRLTTNISLFWILSWEILIEQQQQMLLKKAGNTQHSTKDWLK